METFSALLAICAGNSPVPGEFSTQRPVTRIFDVYFDLRPNKRLSKQSWGWWFETLSYPLWRHRNVLTMSNNGYIVTHTAFQVALISTSYTMGTSGTYVLPKVWHRCSRINITPFILHPHYIVIKTMSASDALNWYVLNHFRKQTVYFFLLFPMILP